MSWSKDYKKSIDCGNPKGFSQKAHCAARKKRSRGEKTQSSSPFNEMNQLKSHKTVEKIAKKHRLDVSFIQKQLDMGEPIEHEHTKDHELAKNIALQHLDEIPDYYTRLKKMEANAKKHHKKFKDVNIKEEGLRDWFGKSKSKNNEPGWVDVVDGDACAREKGETATPKCVSSKKRASMSKSERIAAQAAKRREDPNQPQKYGASKPTMVRTDRKTRKEEMDLQEIKDKPGKGSGKKDACYQKVKSRYKVWPSAYASGALVKCRKVGAANWGTKSEAVEMIRYCPKCKKDETRKECKYGEKFWDMYSLPSAIGKDYDANSPHPGNFPESKQYDHEHSMARSELATIASAVKRLKKKMKGEGNIEAWVQSKITKAADYLDTAADYVDSGEMSEQMFPPINPEAHKAAQKKQKLYNKGSSTDNPHEKEIFLKKSGGPQLPLAKIKNNTQVAHYEMDGELIDEKCWKGYEKKGMKTMFGKRYPNCVKKEEFSNWRADFGLSEDWQKVNRKDKTDGLSQKAVDAYRKENPGSKLQTAVTEKKPKGKRAKRRSNFCRRMKGMKSKLTSAKTAKDPDSKINKALRRWRCN